MKIVKRKGHEEAYDGKKAYASVYAAALSCHYTEKQSEHIAQSVLVKINAYMKSKKSVSSKELREKILTILLDEDVALMYKHHLDIC